MSDKPYWLTGSYCGNCKWWGNAEDEYPPLANTYGFCHRYPPTFDGSENRFCLPDTDAADWCGEYTPKDKEETK